MPARLRHLALIIAIAVAFYGASVAENERHAPSVMRFILWYLQGILIRLSTAPPVLLIW